MVHLSISLPLIINNNWDAIFDYLKNEIMYDKIIKEKPSDEELAIARSVKTNLKALKNHEIEALIRQASCLTEIQVKLYCPAILK